VAHSNTFTKKVKFSLDSPPHNFFLKIFNSAPYVLFTWFVWSFHVQDSMYITFRRQYHSTTSQVLPLNPAYRHSSISRCLHHHYLSLLLTTPYDSPCPSLLPNDTAWPAVDPPFSMGHFPYSTLHNIASPWRLQLHRRGSHHSFHLHFLPLMASISQNFLPWLLPKIVRSRFNTAS